MLCCVYLIVMVLVLVWTYYKLRRRHLEKLAAKIPGFPTLPIIGNIRELKGCKTTTELWKKLCAMSDSFPEGIRKFWLGPTLFVSVWKPEFLEIILNSPFAITKSPIIYEFLTRGLTPSGVFSSNGTSWKELRKPLNKTMRTKSLDEYHSTFVKRTGYYVNFIKNNINKGEFDVVSCVGGVLVDMFIETHLGVHRNELYENKYNFPHSFSKHARLTVERILSCYIFLESFSCFSKSAKEHKALGDRLRTSVSSILQERMQRISGNDEDDFQYYSDFIIKRNLNRKRTEKEMYNELIDVIFAGSDTSTTAASSALVFLAMFPEVQQKAYEEQMMIFGDSSHDPSPKDLSCMVYLTRVIKETLRHVSPGGIFRDLSEDVVVGDYTLPKGTILYLFLQKAHRSPHDWDNPEGFDPDHFLPDKVAARHRYAYLPFSYGARGCPGFQYGMNSIKVLLSGTLRNFKLSTSLKFDEIQYNYSTLLEMSNGFMVKFEERKGPELPHGVVA